MSPGILARAKKVKLLAMDVDGVLTGGEIIILDSGEEIKLWSVKDRMGFYLLKRSRLPVKLAWITARRSRQVQKRAEEIGVHFLFQKCDDKRKAVEDCARRLKIGMREVAYIGDDLVDLAALSRAGLAVCPPDSPPELQKVCHYQTRTAAGRGAVREVIEILIRAQGAWRRTLSHFLALLLLAGFFLSGCGAAQKPVETAERPDQEVDQFKITETLSGMPVWVLNSDLARVYDKQKKVVLDNIRIEFMNAPSRKSRGARESLLLAKKSQTLGARLAAPKGEVKMENHDLVVWGGVEVESQDGIKLYTERLRYATARQKIFTESPVKVVRKDSVLLGEGMEASPDLSTVKIFRHRAEIFPAEMPLKAGFGGAKPAVEH